MNGIDDDEEDMFYLACSASLLFSPNNFLFFALWMWNTSWRTRKWQRTPTKNGNSTVEKSKQWWHTQRTARRCAFNSSNEMKLMDEKKAKKRKWKIISTWKLVACSCFGWVERKIKKITRDEIEKILVSFSLFSLCSIDKQFYILLFIHSRHYVDSFFIFADEKSKHKHM